MVNILLSSRTVQNSCLHPFRGNSKRKGWNVGTVLVDLTAERWLSINADCSVPLKNTCRYIRPKDVYSGMCVLSSLNRTWNEGVLRSIAVFQTNLSVMTRYDEAGGEKNIQYNFNSLEMMISFCPNFVQQIHRSKAVCKTRRRQRPILGRIHGIGGLLGITFKCRRNLHFGAAIIRVFTRLPGFSSPCAPEPSGSTITTTATSPYPLAVTNSRAQWTGQDLACI